MQTQELKIVIDGKDMPCYLARPDGNDPKPAVIVLQEIFGVNREVKRIADLFAGHGYVALAINYYFRTHPNLDEPYTPEGLQHGFAAAGQVTKSNLRNDAQAAIDWLNAQKFVANGQIATVGFCFGGSVAFVTATLPGVKAAVPFYGGSIGAPFPSGEPEGIADIPEVKAPFLIFFGAKDDYIPAETVKRIDDALTAAGKEHEVVVYPNVGHAFFRESSERMNEHEIQDAWSRTLAFLKKHIG